MQYSLALRMDAAANAVETTCEALPAAAVRGGETRRPRFAIRPLEVRPFDQRNIVIRDQGLPLFRVS